jgi:cobalamin biosynthesis protein CobT
MKVLHVFKSVPDETINKLKSAFAQRDEVQEFDMYKGDVDYDELIELVFDNDKVICWW